MTDFSRISLSYRVAGNAPGANIRGGNTPVADTPAASSSIVNASVAVPVRFMTFPGGEQHVWISGDVAGEGRTYSIDARIYSSAGVMNLLLVNDALRRIVGPRAVVELVLPYLPYARQDRVATAGESLSINVFCALINAMKLDRVVICDPHSLVGPALLDNVQVVDVGNYVRQVIEQTDGQVGGQVGEQVGGRAGEHAGELMDAAGRIALVAPDAGAHTRVEALGQAFGLPVVFCGKTRDSKTGRLSNPYVEGKVPDLPLLVVDDICDGGGTFAALAPVLRQHTDQSISLYVTHGLLTKGWAPLKDFARIYTAFPRDEAAWNPVNEAEPVLSEAVRCEAARREAARSEAALDEPPCRLTARIFVANPAQAAGANRPSF